MPKVSKKTVTAKKLADFYGWSDKTIRKWKKSELEQEQNIYKALESYYLSTLQESVTIKSGEITIELSKELLKEFL